MALPALPAAAPAAVTHTAITHTAVIQATPSLVTELQLIVVDGGLRLVVGILILAVGWMAVTRQATISRGEPPVAGNQPPPSAPQADTQA